MLLAYKDLSVNERSQHFTYLNLLDTKRIQSLFQFAQLFSWSFLYTFLLSTRVVRAISATSLFLSLPPISLLTCDRNFFV